MTVENCRFSHGGDSQALGGVIFVESGSMHVTASLFDRNTGWTAIYVGTGGDVVIEHSTMILNEGGGSTHGSALEAQNDGTVTVRHTIMAGGIGQSVRCGTEGAIQLECCDVFDNSGGDFVECIVDQLGVEGNISADPLFCGSTADGDVSIDASSPCAPTQSVCGLIGLGDVACGVPVDATSWGAIKAGFAR